MDRVLALDLGTTSIKASVVDVSGASTATLIACSSHATHAYTDPSASAHQCMDRLLAAIDEIVASLDVRGVTCIALCGQMHGILLYDRVNPSRTSPLITWEDKGSSRALLRACNSALRACTPPAAPVHSGYGCVTLLRLLASRHEWVCGPNAYSGVAPLAAYVASMLTSQSPSMPGSGLPRYSCTVSPSDAAALGFFDAAGGAFQASALEAVAGSVARDGDTPVIAWLPSIQPSGTTLGPVSTHGCDTLRLPSLRRLVGVPVRIALGDHTASVAGAIALATTVSPRGGHQGCACGDVCSAGGALRSAIIVTVGTSAQAVAIGSSDARSTCQAAYIPGRSGGQPCETRPCVNVVVPAACALAVESATEVAVATAAHEGNGDRSRCGTGSIKEATMLVVASVNGGNILTRIATAAATAAYASSTSGCGSTSDATLSAAYADLEARALVGGHDSWTESDDVKQILDAIFAPERAAAGWGIDGDGDEARVSPHVVDDDALYSLPLATLSVAYGAAARRIISRVITCLPTGAWDAHPTVIAVGGAFTRSDVMRQCLLAYVEKAAPNVASPVKFLPLVTAEYAGCIGSAVIAAASPPESSVLEN